jgi:hypothetical protein
MAKYKQLMDLYRFPGFYPQGRIYGIFGDPRAVVIPLKRRGKKQPVVPVVQIIVPSTTERLVGFEIFPAGICASTWTWRFAVFFVAGAKR